MTAADGSPPSPYERLRRICSSFPDVVERPSHGEAAWFVRGKRQFVTTSDHHHDDRVAMWCAARPGAQEQLIEAAPERYFRPPYVGHRGWVGVYLDVPVDWTEVEDLVEDAYRTVAPAGLVARLEGGGSE
jgi:hypothetical protein